MFWNSNILSITLQEIYLMISDFTVTLTFYEEITVTSVVWLHLIRQLQTKCTCY